MSVSANFCYGAAAAAGGVFGSTVSGRLLFPMIETEVTRFLANRSETVKRYVCIIGGAWIISKIAHYVIELYGQQILSSQPRIVGRADSTTKDGETRGMTQQTAFDAGREQLIAIITQAVSTFFGYLFGPLRDILGGQGEPTRRPA